MWSRTAVPFLYEIRTLLDWTCISTSLDWYAWLKLEDIRASLFVAACRNRWAAAASWCIAEVTGGRLPYCGCSLCALGDSSYRATCRAGPSGTGGSVTGCHDTPSSCRWALGVVLLWSAISLSQQQ